MGAIPIPNPFGNCPVCTWNGDTPKFIFVTISGVNKPILDPDAPLYNGLFMLTATAICAWRFTSSCFDIVFALGTPTKITAGVDFECIHQFTEPYFQDWTQNGCATSFGNQIAGDPDFFYHGGTAKVWLGLPATPADWIVDLGVLAADRWKYEHLGADNNLEQIYIGSRKYKTNCRILFDPAQM